MDTISAFARGESARTRKSPQRVFDWDKAAKIIKDEKPIVAIAGLSSDLEWTSGKIYENGKIVKREDTYTYLSSNWATPVLILDDGAEIDCWKYQKDTKWDEHTYWPESAKKILKKK